MGATNPVEAAPGNDSRRPRARHARQPRARLGLARVRRARDRALVHRPRACLTSSPNRAFWDRHSDEYQATAPRAHRPARASLGDVAAARERARDPRRSGREGRARARAAARRSGRSCSPGSARVPVGIDNSERQLEHARDALAAAGLDFPLVHAARRGQFRFPTRASTSSSPITARTASPIPIRGCPRRPGSCGRAASSPSAARPLRGHVLERAGRPHGRRAPSRLLRHAPDRGAGRAACSSSFPYGEWIRLFRANGFEIEALREIQPPDGAESTYRTAEETEWARHWPMEQIWIVRKER